MNLTTGFNNILDEITYDQAIFTKSRIYRKTNNLNNSYDIYVLARLDNRFVWEKTDTYSDIALHFETILFSELRYVRDDNNNYITIYKIYEDVATDLTIYNSKTKLVWTKLGIDLDINNINSYSLLDISTHINLIKEFKTPCAFDDFEPLRGWDNLFERTEDIDIKDNDDFIYPDKDVKDVKDVKGMNDITLEIEIPTEERRMDPYDGEWYTFNEFLEYYGSSVEWDHMSPKKVLLREEYYKFTNKFSDLSEKKYIFLFKQYEKTF
jgi:hypothetical protein